MITMGNPKQLRDRLERFATSGVSAGGAAQTRASKRVPPEPDTGNLSMRTNTNEMYGASPEELAKFLDERPDLWETDDSPQGWVPKDGFHPALYDRLGGDMPDAMVGQMENPSGGSYNSFRELAEDVAKEQPGSPSQIERRSDIIEERLGGNRYLRPDLLVKAARRVRF